MDIFAVTYSEGIDVDTIRQTLDVEYFCSGLCMVEHLTTDGVEVAPSMTGRLTGDAVLYTDGRPTGDVNVIEYGPATWGLPDYRVTCTHCEELISEGTESD